ncbi:putative hydrolase of the HAD superfamily [Pseudonocardia ammonioxydans]|uniref:Putative hydrolase of the HAD superfamily n=1 Tax=Pseudonocardia ammonioxydans TaxID=260086 RepID=A0A1I5IAJ8_PSUAM|nr:HAD family hydrolase [Pseudonocardia ammonioxydans]SFO57645.1 putative hydrolase of the HAD superfamily [Pseudonocardia ammonioxydans]
MTEEKRLCARAVLFDVNGTLVDIVTDEQRDRIYRVISRVLAYSGIDLPRRRLRATYFATLHELRDQIPETYPEFDAVAVWRAIVERHATACTRALSADRLEQLPLFLTELHRGLARRRLRRYPHVRTVLDELRTRYRLGIVTDGQSAYARPELAELGLIDYFDSIVVSGDLGFRKPDERLFTAALDALGVGPERAVYVGNDPFRDIHGAHRAGLHTVLYAPNDDAGTLGCGCPCTPDHVITDHRRLPEHLE